MLLTLPSLSLLAFACVPAVALSDTRPPNGLSHARRQSVTGQNPFDHSWITEWAALGDSFASGPGAGKRSNWWCSRYDGAYGNLINNDQSLGVNPNRNFHYLACLGQTTSEILRDQVNSLSNQQMMITMSAGGNDVGFGDLVDACIYQYEKRNWECDPQLEKTKKAILGDEFSQNLDKLMQATVKKLAYPNSRVFWTAYSKFFDTTTKDCDSVTWATILAIGRREFLTVARRQQFNDLVDLINGKLKDAAKRAGNQVVIVEWEDKIDTITGRYCEPGVDETAGKGDDRESLAYYEWYSTLDDKVYRNGVSDSMVKSIPQIDTNQSAATAPADQMGPYQANIIRNISESIKADPTLIPNFQALNTELHGINDPVQIASILSDKILRNFHPQSNAHQRIAAAVLTALEQDQAHDINQPSATTTAIGCTAPTGISSLPGVRDHCYRDKPVDHQIKFRADNAEIAIATFCNSHAGQLVTGGDGIKESRPNDDSDTTALVLRVSRRSDGDCKPGDHEPEIHLSDFECIAYMRNALHMCDTDTRDEKQGGVYVSECVEYSINGVTVSPNTQNIDSGVLNCRSANNANKQGDAQHFMTLDDINSSADEFCQGLKANKRKFGPGETGQQTTATSHGGVVSLTWEGGNNCPPAPDFSGNGADAAVDLCKKRLSNPINLCDTSSNGNQLWKQGGKFFRDCTEWEIGRGVL